METGIIYEHLRFLDDGFKVTGQLHEVRLMEIVSQISSGLAVRLSPPENPHPKKHLNPSEVFFVIWWFPTIRVPPNHP